MGYNYIALFILGIVVLIILFKSTQSTSSSIPSSGTTQSMPSSIGTTQNTPSYVKSTGTKPYGCCEKGELKVVFEPGKSDTFDACKQAAIQRGMTYFGLKGGRNYNGQYVGECWGTPFINDMSSLSVSTRSTNCETIPGTDVSSGKDSATFLYRIV